jgi:hypothetical protein
MVIVYHPGDYWAAGRCAANSIPSASYVHVVVEAQSRYVRISSIIGVDRLID